LFFELDAPSKHGSAQDGAIQRGFRIRNVYGNRVSHGSGATTTLRVDPAAGQQQIERGRCLLGRFVRMAWLRAQLVQRSPDGVHLTTRCLRAQRTEGFSVGFNAIESVSRKLVVLSLGVGQLCPKRGCTLQMLSTEVDLLL
jgi:hypothetical protein